MECSIQLSIRAYLVEKNIPSFNSRKYSYHTTINKLYSELPDTEYIVSWTSTAVSDKVRPSLSVLKNVVCFMSSQGTKVPP